MKKYLVIFLNWFVLSLSITSAFGVELDRPEDFHATKAQIKALNQTLRWDKETHKKLMIDVDQSAWEKFFSENDKPEATESSVVIFLDKARRVVDEYKLTEAHQKEANFVVLSILAGDWGISDKKISGIELKLFNESRFRAMAKVLTTPIHMVDNEIEIESAVKFEKLIWKLAEELNPQELESFAAKLQDSRGISDFSMLPLHSIDYFDFDMYPKEYPLFVNAYATASAQSGIRNFESTVTPLQLSIFVDAYISDIQLKTYHTKRLRTVFEDGLIVGKPYKTGDILSKEIYKKAEMEKFVHNYVNALKDVYLTDANLGVHKTFFIHIPSITPYLETSTFYQGVPDNIRLQQINLFDPDVRNQNNNHILQRVINFILTECVDVDIEPARFGKVEVVDEKAFVPHNAIVGGRGCTNLDDAAKYSATAINWLALHYNLPMSHRTAAILLAKDMIQEPQEEEEEKETFDDMEILHNRIVNEPTHRVPFDRQSFFP